MEKKLALLFLPVLMALTSCNGAVKPVDDGVILEDTTACSEIFEGRDFIGGKLGNIKQRNTGEAISTPKMGYQIHYEDGKLAVRFVAAIKDLNVKAYWKRGVAAPTGNALQNKKFSDTRQEAVKYYTTLSDGTNTIVAGEDEYADYAGFVVYTIHNIPYSATNKKAYIAAYVNLVADENGEDNGAGGTYDIHNNSAALAVSIERKTDNANETELKNVFAFDPTVTGHFLEGTINDVVYDGGANGLYRESDPSRKGEGNFAWYENIALKATDSFGSFYYEHDTSFEYFGGHEFFDKSAGFFKKSASISGYVTPILQGTYEIHISSGDANHIYTEAKSYTEELSTIKSAYSTLYLVPGAWNEANAWYCAHFFDGASSDVAMNDEDHDGIYEVSIPSGANKVVVCRMGPNEGTSELGWYIFDRPVWNKTGDIVLDERFTYAGPLGTLIMKAAGNYQEQWLGGVSDLKNA